MLLTRLDKSDNPHVILSDGIAVTRFEQISPHICPLRSFDPPAYPSVTSRVQTALRMNPINDLTVGRISVYRFPQ